MYVAGGESSRLKMKLIRNIFRIALIFLGLRRPYISMNVGIDYSIRSSSACFYDGTDIKWILYPINQTLQKKAICKRLEETGLVEIFFSKSKIEGSYTEKERGKMLEAICLSNKIVDSVQRWADDKDERENFFFAFEGVSFGSKGNSLVDTSMSVGVTRSKLVSLFGAGHMHVFAPTSIKMFAGKGNYNKIQMRDALMSRPEVPDSMKVIFSDPEYTDKNGKLAGVLTDLIDSTWIALYLKNIIK